MADNRKHRIVGIDQALPDIVGRMRMDICNYFQLISAAEIPERGVALGMKGDDTMPQCIGIQVVVADETIDVFVSAISAP